MTVRDLVRYDRSYLRGDVVAGITVTAYLIPQVMAYSTLAGLTPQTGLWAVVVALVIYALVGTSRLLSVGPESTTALLTAATLAPLAVGDATRYAALAALLAAIVGIYALAAWALQLGFVGDLLSKPVLVGYMAGIALIMIASQLGKITGLEVEGDTFVTAIRSFVESIGESEVSWWSVVIGLSVTAALLLLTPRFPRFPVTFIVMLAATALVALVDLDDAGVATVGTLTLGSPGMFLPSIGVADVGPLLLPAIGIFFVGFADNTLTARMFAARRHQQVDSNRELLAMGATNLGSAAVAGFPVSSSASRSVLASASGAQTQMYSIVAAVLVVVSVLVFASVIAAFPVAALAGLVTYAAIRLIDIAEFRRLWSFRRREFALAVAAVLGVLVLDILYGILAAVALSIVELLTRVGRPHWAVLGQPKDTAGWHDVDDFPDAEQIPGLVVFRYDSPLFFANADNFVRAGRQAVSGAEQPVRWLLINMEGNTEFDISGLDGLEDLRAWCAAEGVIVALVRVKRVMRDALLRHGVAERIGLDRIHPTLPTAVAAYEQWRGDPR